MKIGILGGTFDPIHTGHLSVAEAAYEQLPLDKILFVPAYLSPHKEKKTFHATPEDRLEMVRLGIQDVPYFEVSECEFQRGGVSYTVETLRELKKEYLNAELYLILGFDAHEKFSTWRDPEEIQKLAKLVVANRVSVADSETSHSIVVSCGDVSSTSIRALIENDQDISKLVPEPVEAYIRNQNLYTVEGKPF